MPHQLLAGRTLLVLEDEPLLLFDIEAEFAATGAELKVTTMLQDAALHLEQGDISAAILDHSIGQGNSSYLYDRLSKFGIPFVIYTCHDIPENDRKGGFLLSKPALPGALVAAVERLLSPTH